MNEELGGRREYLVMPSTPLGSAGCLKRSHLQDVMRTVQIPLGSDLRQLPCTLGCYTLKTAFLGTPQEPFTILGLFALKLSFPPCKAIPQRITTGAARDKADTTTHILAFLFLFCFSFLLFLVAVLF